QRSFWLQPRLLDDLLSKFALLADVACELIDPLACGLDGAVGVHALAERRFGHDAVGVARDLLDDRPRHAALREQAEPRGRKTSAGARLLERRHPGNRGERAFATTASGVIRPL